MSISAAGSTEGKQDLHTDVVVSRIDRDTCISFNAYLCAHIHSHSLSTDQPQLTSFLGDCQASMEAYQTAQEANTKKTLKTRAGKLDDAHSAFQAGCDAVVTETRQGQRLRAKSRQASTKQIYFKVMRGWGVDEGWVPGCICNTSSTNMAQWDEYVRDRQAKEERARESRLPETCRVESDGEVEDWEEEEDRLEAEEESAVAV